VADNPNARSQVKEITDRLEQGMKDLFTSEKYMSYLQTMSRFHRYSTRNTLLIHMQKPDATLVAGYQAWQSKFGRYVKKGEHAIKILAPVPFTFTEEKQKLDPDTRRPILGADGLPVLEEVERRLARFKPTSVFDVSQTDGKPLPTLVEDLTGDVRHYELFMDSLRAVSPLPIVSEPLTPGTDGECRMGVNIAIREGMSEVQTVSAAIHEITHAKLHDIEVIRQQDETAKPKDRRTEEVEAESVSYAVCQYYGIETAANSLGYIADWSKNRELKELNASLDTIRKTAAELIEGIDKQYRALAKSRGIDLTVDIPAPETTIDTPASIEASAPQQERETPASEPEQHPLVAEYARAKSDLLVGTNVLMMPVFDDGNYNRAGKRIRVTVEEPAGKYQLFSHDENGDKALYFMTASGRIDRTSEYFRNEWDEQQHKYVNIVPTEAEFDEVIPQIAEAFERDMADPAKWAKYQHAAVVNRLDECEAHNIPVRQLRAEEDKRSREAQARQDAEEKKQKQEKFDARVDEIANAIKDGKDISVGYDEDAFDGKNPMLDLFRLYGVDLPLRTQGWVNTGLASISESGYRYFNGKHQGNSTTFNDYFAKLRAAIKAMPIEQKRAELNPAKPDPITEADKFLEDIGGIGNLFGAPTPPPKPITPEQVEKQYDLGYGFMGNGLTVWNRAEEKNGDYVTVAHIDRDRSVTFYDKDMPEDVRARIEETARTSEMTVSATQDTPIFNTPLVDELTMQRVDREVQAILQMFIDRDLESHGELSEKTLENIAVQGYEYRDGKLEIAVKEQAPLPEKQPGYEEWSEAATAENAPDQPGVASDDVSAYLPEQKPEADNNTDFIMPDAAIGLSERDLYGYTGEDILPLTQERALELFAQDMTIYMLYPDNTEAMVFESEEIAAHDGIFGIDASEWHESREYRSMAAERSEGTREAMLLYGEENAFGIYQLKSGDDLHYHRFTPLDQMNKEGLTIDRANYELVYTAPLTDRIEFLTDRYPVLSKIYDTFNTQRPEDFTGHSLSVSDVVVLKYNGDYSSHFVDSGGFVEIDAFLGGETRQEQAAEAPALTSSQVGNKLEQETGYTPDGGRLQPAPTVAELEAAVKAGEIISLSDLARAVKSEEKTPPPKGKASILAQLQEYKNSAAQGADSQKTAPKHDANREV